MYKDVISYELAEGITIQHLLSVVQMVIKEWMQHRPGYIKWEVHRNQNGNYTDIVYWESKEHAQEAEKEMLTIPHLTEWFACYKEGSISFINLTEITTFSKE